MDCEQRVNFTFKKSDKEAHNMLKTVYGYNLVTLKTFYKWYESVEDDSTKELTEELNIS